MKDIETVVDPDGTIIGSSIYNEVGNTMYSRDKSEKGTVKKIQSRYCAACYSTSLCYVVEWSDGKITKPCIHGIGIDEKPKNFILYRR